MNRAGGGAYFTVVAGAISLAACGGRLTAPQSPNQPPLQDSVVRASANNDWRTVGYDLGRTGYNPNEHTIGTGSFGTFHQVWSASTGGQIGEPTYAANVTINGVSTNVVYVGSGSTIYALNAANGQKIWTKKLGIAQYQCGTHQYTFGITGTAVIDRATHRIYVADGAATVHALSLATGAEQAGWPIPIATPANQNFIYGGLTYNRANTTLYVPTSANCDRPSWYGRVSAVNTATAKIVNSFFPTQGTSGGGVWGFGGASVDAATNDVFIATGNADTSGGAKQNAFYAEQVLSLSPDLSTVIGHDYPNLFGSGDDLDFGATPMLFQPSGCGPMAAAINKDGFLYLYDRTNISAGPIQSIQMSITTDNADTVGMPAFDPVTNYVYVEQPATFKNSTYGVTYRPGVAAFSVGSGCMLNPAPVWSASFGGDGATNGNDSLRSPIAIANGVLYISDYDTSQTYAFDAATGAQLWTAALSGPGAVGPIVANGKVFIGSLGPKFTAWSP